MNGVPGDGAGLLLVPAKHLHLLAEIPDIKQLQQVVSAGGHQPVSVVVPLQIHHRRLVGMPEREDGCA